MNVQNINLIFHSPHSCIFIPHILLDNFILPHVMLILHFLFSVLSILFSSFYSEPGLPIVQGVQHIRTQDLRERQALLATPPKTGRVPTGGRQRIGCIRALPRPRAAIASINSLIQTLSHTLLYNKCNIVIWIFFTHLLFIFIVIQHLNISQQV